MCEVVEETEEQDRQCQFNPEHSVRPSRYRHHLSKCCAFKRAKEKGIAACKYNSLHFFYPHELDEHHFTCPDRPLPADTTSVIAPLAGRDGELRPNTAGCDESEFYTQKALRCDFALSPPRRKVHREFVLGETYTKDIQVLPSIFISDSTKPKVAWNTNPEGLAQATRGRQRETTSSDTTSGSEEVNTDVRKRREAPPPVKFDLQLAYDRLRAALVECGTTTTQSCRICFKQNRNVCCGSCKNRFRRYLEQLGCIRLRNASGGKLCDVERLLLDHGRSISKILRQQI